MPRGGKQRGTSAHEILREDIQREYLDSGKSMREACRFWGCSPKILIQAMRNYGMRAPEKTRALHGRPLEYTQLENHEWLVEQLEKRTVTDIAREIGADRVTVRDYAVRHGLFPAHAAASVSIRTAKQKMMHVPKHTQISAEEIAREYLSKDVTLRQAADVLGCSVTVLRAALKAQGFSSRDRTWKVAVKGGHSGRWSGREKVVNNRGYVTLSIPGHPLANSAGLVLEHRLVAEQMLGRPLEKVEVVHHVNYNRTDNRPENLVVFASNAEHRIFHHAEEQAVIDELFDTIEWQEAQLQRYRALYGLLPEEPPC